jgi:hypothetical protein
MINSTRPTGMDTRGIIRIVQFGILLAFATLLLGCAALRPHSPPPRKYESMVQIPGMAGVRAWGDEFSPVFQQDAIVSKAQEKRSGIYEEGSTVNILAISGGGGDGAFGAGLLCGWTTAGTRPSFKLVTGVSTGALTAPFAFLGPAYDAKLRQVYTTITSSDIFMMKSLLAIFFSDAIALNDPLANLTARIVDEQMLKDVAAEHLKGRRLYVSTTALDAQRPVVWNMGAIAASGHPLALDLFRQVMIASAAVPVAFPPVYFPVEANGKRFDEMHVDGGVTNQVFLYGPMLDPQKFRTDPNQPATRRARVYIIRNTQIKPDWQEVRPRLGAIGPRSVSTLIKAQGSGDLFRIFATSQRDNLDFNLAFIPDALDTNREDEFDSRVMNLLFETGYKLAKVGYHWHKSPPGFIPVKNEEGQEDSFLPAAAAGKHW